MGWNGSGVRKGPIVQRQTSGHNRRHLFLFILVALALVFGLYLFVGGRSCDAANKKIHRTPEPIREVRAAKVARAKSAATQSIAKAESDEALTTNGTPKPRPRPLVDMSRMRPQDWDRLTNRTFRSGTEQLMSWVFTTQPGDMPMPIPEIGKADRANLVQILISKNRITDQDTDFSAYSKQQVDFAKKEMAKYVADGGDPDDFLQFYHQELKLAFNKRNDAIAAIEAAKDEDHELAEGLRIEINKKFDAEGIRPIPKMIMETESFGPND